MLSEWPWVGNMLNEWPGMGNMSNEWPFFVFAWLFGLLT